MLRNFFAIAFLFAVLFPFAHAQTPVKKTFDDAELRKILDPEVYRVMRENGTEDPFTGALLNNKKAGDYYCAVCHTRLFSSDTKFDSHCGWPSFFAPASEKSLIYKTDHSHGMTRTEIRCGVCNSHLGHVFDDGPPPTGKRYCLNSVALVFVQNANVKNSTKGQKTDIKKNKK